MLYVTDIFHRQYFADQDIVAEVSEIPINPAYHIKGSRIVDLRPWLEYGREGAEEQKPWEDVGGKVLYV